MTERYVRLRQSICHDVRRGAVTVSQRLQTQRFDL